MTDEWRCSSCFAEHDEFTPHDDEVIMDTPTAGERKRGRRKVLDNRRSVFLMSALSSGQARRQSSRRKRGA